VLEGARYAGTEYQTVMQAVPIRTTTVEAERNDASTTKVVRQETEYVPVTQAYDQYQFTAIYFAKSEYKSALGIYAIDIPPSLRDKLQRNTGAVIKIVYEESPAFNANLMGGDIIVELNGALVNNAKMLKKLSEELSVKKARLKIIRSGKEKNVDVMVSG